MTSWARSEAGGEAAVDWFMAGRAARRTLRSARTGETTNLNADYGFVEQQGHALQDKGGGI